jgi:hypothetical protein
MAARDRASAPRRAPPRAPALAGSRRRVPAAAAPATAAHPSPRPPAPAPRLPPSLPGAKPAHPLLQQLPPPALAALLQSALEARAAAPPPPARTASLSETAAAGLARLRAFEASQAAAGAAEAPPASPLSLLPGLSPEAAAALIMSKTESALSERGGGAGLAPEAAALMAGLRTRLVARLRALASAPGSPEPGSPARPASPAPTAPGAAPGASPASSGHTCLEPATLAPARGEDDAAAAAEQLLALADVDTAAGARATGLAPLGRAGSDASETTSAVAALTAAAAAAAAAHQPGSPCGSGGRGATPPCGRPAPQVFKRRNYQRPNLLGMARQLGRTASTAWTGMPPAPAAPAPVAPPAPTGWGPPAPLAGSISLPQGLLASLAAGAGAAPLAPAPLAPALSLPACLQGGDLPLQLARTIGDLGSGVSTATAGGALGALSMGPPAALALAQAQAVAAHAQAQAHAQVQAHAQAQAVAQAQAAAQAHAAAAAAATAVSSGAAPPGAAAPRLVRACRARVALQALLDDATAFESERGAAFLPAPVGAALNQAVLLLDSHLLHALSAAAAATGGA